MRISFFKDKFIGYLTPLERPDELKDAGFVWDNMLKRFVTTDYKIAEKLLKFCDENAVYHIMFNKRDVNAEQNIKDSYKTESDFRVFHPETLKPFPFQIAGVEFMMKRDAVLLADQMGLGKTIQALLTMNMRTDVEALIVCPSILKYNWLKEARKSLIGELLAFVYEGKKIRYYKATLTPHKKKTILHIINYDILSKFKKRLSEINYNFFVADECHNIKNISAKRTKVSQELAKKARYKIFITGTPIYNKPKDLYVVLNLIDPAMFNNFQVFADRYCGAEKVNVGLGGKKRMVTKYEGATNLDELNRILRGNYMIRRMKEEVLKELPEKLKDVVVLDEDDLAGLVEKEKNAVAVIKQQQDILQAEVNKLRELAQDNKAYEETYKDRVKKLRNIKMNGFGEIARIRKEIAVKKIPYVVDFVKDILENSEDKQSKVVVFGHHQEVIYGLAEQLKEYFPLVITGQTNDAERQKNIMLFKEKNPHRIFIGSMGAAGTGVDGLQNNCNTVVFAELDWTPALVQQAEDRLQRIGQKNTVWVYHIVANDSIDARIAKIMVQKDNVAKQILDMKPEQLYNALV